MTIYLRIRKPVQNLDWPPPDPLPEGLEEWPDQKMLKAEDDKLEAAMAKANREFSENPDRILGGPELVKVEPPKAKGKR